MANQPLVSAITIFLNAERFIEEAIESVFAQTYRAWELLLVDDGSTDGSTAIARRYAEAHPDRIRYLEHENHENRGMSAARNLGIRHARGGYVAFLDADDVWLPHKLEQQVALLEAHPEAGMLMGASLYWHGWTGREEHVARDRMVPVGGPQDTLVQPPALLNMLYPLGRGAAPCPGSLLFRHQALDAVGGFEDSFCGFYEDQALLAKLYLHTPVWVASICCDRYRQHSDSCVANTRARGDYHVVRKYFLDWFEAHLRQQEVVPEVWRALNEAFMPYRRPVTWFLRGFYREFPRALLRRLRRALPDGLPDWRSDRTSRHRRQWPVSSRIAPKPPGHHTHSERS